MMSSVPRYYHRTDACVFLVLIVAAAGLRVPEDAGLRQQHAAPVRWNANGFYNYPHPQEKQTLPQEIMTDVVNRLGLDLLAVHNENNENNIAISPYGALSVLVVLGEGLQGDAVREIQEAAKIPNDISVIRVGLRNIHRHLKSYFIPKQGFLAGLRLNHDNITLRPEYEDILKYYGFDIMAFNSELFPESETPTSTTPAALTVTASYTDVLPTSATKTTTTEAAATTPAPPPTTTTVAPPATTSTTQQPTTTTVTTTTTEPPSSTVASTVPPATTTQEPKTTQVTTTTQPTTTTIVQTTTTEQPPTTVSTEAVTDEDEAEYETEIVTEIVTEFVTEIVEEDEANTETGATSDTTAEEGTTTATEALTSEAPSTTPEAEKYTDQKSAEKVIELNLPRNTTRPKPRKPRSVVDYLLAKYHDDFYVPEGMKDTAGRTFLPSDKQLEPIQMPQPSSPPSFLVYGKYLEREINFMRYDAVLPYYFAPHLNSVALSFPLDSANYYLLLLLPTDERAVDVLVHDLRLNGSLKYIIKSLRRRRVSVTIPSFMLKGYVNLTPSLQKLGIRRIFEPRQADFSPLTNNTEIYVTNIEQAITVNIRNYVDPTMLDENSDLKKYNPIEFKADHPFLYFVMDSQLHVALMAGKVVNPINSRIR